MNKYIYYYAYEGNLDLSAPEQRQEPSLRFVETLLVPDRLHEKCNQVAPPTI